METNKTTELVMLGTGNAAVTRCYNTCFALRCQDKTLLVDAEEETEYWYNLKKQAYR